MFYYLLILFFILLIVHYLVKFTYWRRRNIPGPIPFPIVGNALDSIIRDCRDVELDGIAKYGDLYGVYIGSIPLLVCSNAEMVKIITQKEAKNFTDINLFKMDLRFFKDSFLTKKGQEWKNGRNLITPCFTTKKIKEIYPQIQKASGPYFQNIDESIRKQEDVDIKKYTKGFSLDVIGKFVFAFDLNSAKDKDNPFVIAGTSVTKIKLWKMALFNLLPRKIIEMIDLQLLNKDSLDYLDNLITALTKQRRQNKDIHFNDFLDMLLRKIDENNLNVTQNEIIAHCVIFFFAGLETVSSTTSNVFLNLSKPENIHYQEKLYEELINLYPDGEIEYDRLNDSKLLDAIINETIRLYPALIRIIRIAENEIEIKGIKIDAGTTIHIPIYAMHMDKDFWGDPEIFRPERFLDNDFRTENENEIHFMPFGSGPRSCVAERLGLCQLKYLIAKTIINYKIYRTKNFKINYIKNPVALLYDELLLGFVKRNDNK